MGNLFELEDAVIFITFMNVPVLQGVDSVFCPLVTGSGKDRAGIMLQLRNGQSFRRIHAKGFLFGLLCLYLMHSFYMHLLPSPVRGTWDVEVIQLFCHLSNSSF